MQALREISSSEAGLFEQLAQTLSDPGQRSEAIAALAACKASDANARLLTLWPDLTLPQRRSTLDHLASSKSGAQSVLDAAIRGDIAKTDLNGSTLDKLSAVLGTTPQLDALLAEMESLLRPVLRLDGRNTRDRDGIFRIFFNSELDATSKQANTNTFVNLDVGRTIPSSGGTAGELSEYRVWNRARTADEIRTGFDQSFADEPRPAGLTHWFGGKHWPSLYGGAKVEREQYCPLLLTAGEAKAQEERFAKFRSLIAQAGNPVRGRELFTTICMTCHSVGGQGAQIGPVLNGAGAMGVEALLRATLTPNAAMEAGYRVFRVELRDGDLVDGLLVSQDNEAIVLRRSNAEDLRVPQASVRRSGFTRMSMMPEGLLEAMQPREVADLFAYLQTLR